MQAIQLVPRVIAFDESQMHLVFAASHMKLVLQIQTDPLTAPVPLRVGQVKQAPLGRVICVLAAHPGLPHDPPVAVPTQLTPLVHPHEVVVAAYPVDFVREEQAVQTPPTRIDKTGSHSHVFLLGLYLLPTAQFVASHLKVT